MQIKKARRRQQPGTGAPAPAVSDEVAPTRGESISHAYDQLRELIVWGRLAPGTRIVESEIAERLGVSRTPARSALHRLQQEGYVTGGSERRPVVAPLTQTDGRELFQIVGVLEALAAREAAARPTDERATLTDRMRAFNDALAATARELRPDPQRIFDLDTAFHHAYVEAGAGPRLIGMHEAIKPQAERYMRLYISSLVDEIATSVVEHETIVRAIESGDALAAQVAAETNWRNAATRLAGVIEAHGERGSW